MRKILLIICLTALIVLAGAIVIQILTSKPRPIEEVLPSGAVGYVRIVNLEKHLKDFTKSKFWQGISQINYQKVMQLSGSNEREITQVQAFLQQLSSPATQQIIGKFLGNEMALAFYPTALENIDPNDMAKSAGNIFLVTRLGPESKMVDFLTAMLIRGNKNISVQTQKYRGQDIQIITNNDNQLRIAYVRIKDLYVVGIGDGPARASLDVVAKEKPALNQDAQYLATKGHVIPGEELFGYLNFDSFISTIKKSILGLAGKEAANNAVFQQQLDENFKMVQGFKTIGLSVAFENLTKLKMNIHFDKKTLDPDIRSLYACMPKENKSLSFIPKEVIGYQWAACQDFTYNWKQSQKEMDRIRKLNPQAPDPEAQVAAIEQQLKISLQKDVLPIMGDEMGGYLLDINTQGSFPLPKLLIFLNIKDKDKAEKILETLLGQQPLLRLETENYKDVAIHYVMIPLVMNLDPTYAFIGNYLAISTNRETMKASIDAAGDATKVLAMNTRLQQIKIDLAQPANSVIFLQADQLMSKFAEVIGWLDKWVTTQIEKQDAFIKGSEQRLSDITKHKEQWQTEAKSLQQELDGLLPRSKGGNAPGSSLEKNTDDIERTQKVINTIKDNLALDQKEEKELMAIKQSKELALPPEGEKRLTEVAAEIEKKQKKIEAFNNELQGLKERQKKLQADAVRIEQLQKTLEQNNKNIATAQGTEKELQDIIASYQAQTVDQGKQKVFVDNFLKPLAKALGNIKVVATKIMFGDGIIETLTHIRGE